MAYTKDLIRAEREGDGASPSATTSAAAHFVPETKRVARLIREMQEGKFHSASWSTSTAAQQAWSPSRT